MNMALNSLEAEWNRISIADQMKRLAMICRITLKKGYSVDEFYEKAERILAKNRTTIQLFLQTYDRLGERVFQLQ